MKNFGMQILLGTFFILNACNPLGQTEINAGNVGASTPTPAPAPVLGPLTANIWNLISANSSTFAYDSTKIDFNGPGGVCELIPTTHLDDQNNTTGSAGFNAGTLVGTAWDATHHLIHLTTTTNNAELDSSWTPKYANLFWYMKMNGSGAIASSLAPDVGSGTVDVNTAYASYTSGILNNAIQGTPGGLPIHFNGSNIETISDKITIAGWVKTVGTASNWSLLMQFSNGVGWYLQRYGATSNLFFEVITSAGSYTVGTAAMPALDGNWHHFVYVAGSGNLDAYLDGVNVDHQSYVPGTGGFASSAGYYYLNSPTTTGSTNVDDLAIWHDAFTAADVKVLYARQSAKYSGMLTSRVFDAGSTNAIWSSLAWTSTLPFLKALTTTNETQSDYSALVNSSGVSGNSDLATQLVSVWHLDEAGGTTGAGSIKDAVGVSNGTPTAGMVFGGAGKLGNSAIFDGSNYITTTTAPSVTGSFTVSAWVYPMDPTNTLNIFSTRTGDGNGFDLKLDYGNTIHSDISNGTSWLTTTADVTYAYQVNQWYHIVYVVKPTSYAVFVNGVSLGGNSISGTPLLMDSTRLPTLGVDASGFIHPFKGMIDEVAVWNRALQAQEVTQLYRRGANRIKFQVRSCATANAGKTDCTDDATGANWKGPDGTNQSYYSEVNNSSASSPSLTFSNFAAPSPSPHPYFQYRAILETDDASTSPELKSVTIGPNHYDSSAPTVVSHNGIHYYSLSAALESLGSGGCSSGVVYNLGIGATYNTATWYWWNGATWSAAGGTSATANSRTVVNAHLTGFPENNLVYLKAFLQSSSGSSACQLNSFELDGLN